NEAPARGLEQAVKEGNVFAFGEIAAYSAVDLLAQSLWRRRGCRKGLDQRLQVRHDQRRRHPLAHHVADTQRGASLVELNDVEVTAARGAGGAPGDVKFAPFEDWHVAGKKALLILFGGRQFTVARGFQTLLAPSRAARHDLIAQDPQQPRVLPGLLHKVGDA